MSEFCIIYYDLVEIPTDILSVVNIGHYGNLHYRKKKLGQYHRAVFKDLGINQFCHIQTLKDLEQFIGYYSRSNIDVFIFLTSAFAIVHPQSFTDFIKRVQYIDSPLGIFDNEGIKSFVKLNKKLTMDLMEMLLVSKHSPNQILVENFSFIEKFKKEHFYLEISSYIEFIKFLHSNFELRYFNSLESNGLVVTKSSVKKAKMLSEYTYFDFVPESLKIYFLRPFDFKETEKQAQYSLEQLNVPDLAIQWIHYSINVAQFKVLMERIFTFLRNRPVKKTNAEAIQLETHKSYISKLETRLSEFKISPIFDQIDTLLDQCTIYRGLDDVFAHYLRLYEKISKQRKNDSEQYFGHGDLCFSNILYDKRIDFIKFIDPKGCTSADEAYFDRYYDVAKLSHSVLGNYDFINNGIFNIAVDNNLKISLTIDVQENRDAYEETFVEYLEKNQFDYKLVRLYEASLFLSMLPLHIDYPKKVLAFVLTAISIFETLEN